MTPSFILSQIVYSGRVTTTNLRKTLKREGDVDHGALHQSRIAFTFVVLDVIAEFLDLSGRRNERSKLLQALLERLDVLDFEKNKILRSLREAKAMDCMLFV